MQWCPSLILAPREAEAGRSQGQAPKQLSGLARLGLKEQNNKIGCGGGGSGAQCKALGSSPMLEKTERKRMPVSSDFQMSET